MVRWACFAERLAAITSGNARLGVRGAVFRQVRVSRDQSGDGGQKMESAESVMTVE